MILRRQLAWMAAVAAMTASTAYGAPRPRINLVDFGSVVHFGGDVGAAPSAEKLERGGDGWPATQAPDGQFTIGVEWDEPLALTEVNIEFRHAIANREKLVFQYWQESGKKAPAEGETSPRAHGRWVTPKLDWWAGDRDVSFQFVGTQAGAGGMAPPAAGLASRPTSAYPLTRRIRFLCGRDELPAVRYLRAYGPGSIAESVFDVRFDEGATLKPPVLVATTNGYVIAGDNKTTMESARIDRGRGTLTLRFAAGGSPPTNETTVALRSIDDADQELVFRPFEVARLGQQRFAAAGVTIERRGGKLTEVAPAATATPGATQPADTR